MGKNNGADLDDDAMLLLRPKSSLANAGPTMLCRTGLRTPSELGNASTPDMLIMLLRAAPTRGLRNLPETPLGTGSSASRTQAPSSVAAPFALAAFGGAAGATAALRS